MNEVASDILMSTEKTELKGLFSVSSDKVDDDTPETPEKIEPSTPVRGLRSLNKKIEVKARYLDPPPGSCHDFCKHGKTNLKESTSSFLAKKKKLFVHSNSFSGTNGVNRVANLPISPAKSTIKRSVSLSKVGAKSNEKFSDAILGKGVGTFQVSPMGDLLSKGKKKELVTTNAQLSPKPPINRAMSGKFQNVKELKELSRLKRYSSFKEGEKKKPMNDNIPEEKKSVSGGNKIQSTGQTQNLENKKGKQKVPDAVVTGGSSLITPKKSSGLKREQSGLSKGIKRLDKLSISERSITKTQKQMPKKKVEPNSRPKRIGKKLNLEEEKDPAYKLAFKSGKVVDVKTNNTAPRRLKFKPRKVAVDNLRDKADDGSGSKSAPVKKMINHKVGITNRLKRVVKVGVYGKNEKMAHKLDFERGKVIDIQPMNIVARRLKFKPRKAVGEKINGDNSRRNLKKVVSVGEVKGLDIKHLKVALKHQSVEGKKHVESLLNNVIEETASRLVRLRKSKVKALVGAFESVMALPDGKSSTTSAS